MSAEAALEVLFLAEPDAGARGCLALDAPVACLLARRYAEDRAVAEQAQRLYATHGIVLGIEAPHTMDGGYRGMIAIVPHLPVGKERRHVAWVADAFDDFSLFISKLTSKSMHGVVDFRVAPLAVRFFRSVGRKTPSAYAAGWRIGYNVSGSLHRSGAAVRETLFHEVFHLNDEAHGAWSLRALGGLHASIVERCVNAEEPSASIPCLRPYAPGTTRVRGGTYYAFQPGNDAQEYGAELALRYYQEHRLVLAGERLRGRPFKCGPEENRIAWELLRDEFFGGVDLVEPCAISPGGSGPR